MNFIRALLLVLTVVLIPGGLILLIPIFHRGYRWLVEARRTSRHRAEGRLTLENGEIKA